MARAIDADRMKEELLWGNVFLSAKETNTLVDLIDDQPTLTTPSEPLTCDGCIHEHNEHEKCNYCMRASYLNDYYIRQQKVGENDGVS